MGIGSEALEEAKATRERLEQERDRDINRIKKNLANVEILADMLAYDFVKHVYGSVASEKDDPLEKPSELMDRYLDDIMEKIKKDVFNPYHIDSTFERFIDALPDIVKIIGLELRGFSDGVSKWHKERGQFYKDMFNEWYNRKR